MTRLEILEQYEVDANGIIRSPGKFESEMLYVPAYWDHYLNGCADDDNGEVLTFYLDETDRAEWPELAGDATALHLAESGDGFVTCWFTGKAE